MTDVITVHDHKFAIEGDGFVRNNATEDFRRGVQAIENYLAAMPSNEVAAYHHVLWDWVANDCDAERPEIADTLESVAHAVATEGWHNPGAVFVSVSAII